MTTRWWLANAVLLLALAAHGAQAAAPAAPGELPAASGSAVPAASGSAVPAASGSAVPAASGSAVPAASGSAVPAASGSAVPAASGSAVPAPSRAAAAHAAASKSPRAIGFGWGDGRTSRGSEPIDTPAVGAPYAWRQMALGAAIMAAMLGFMIWLIRRHTRERRAPQD